MTDSRAEAGGTSESQPIRWGILGTARIAEKLADAIRQSKTGELIAIASRSSSRAREWAAKHHVPNAFGSYDALVSSDEIDAVYIPLPPSMHAEWTIRCAELGKHVLCEKPLAVSVTETHEMIEACRKHERLLMDGVMWVHHPRTAEFRRVLHDGPLGFVRRVTSAFSFHREFPASDLRMQRALGGGSLLDLGWYCVGATLWAFDELPNSVYGNARYQRDVDVNFSGMMWFDGNRNASFDCGFDTTMRRWIEIAGTSASLVCDDFTKPWQEDSARFWTHGAEGKMSEHNCEAAVQEVCMVDHFGKMVQSGDLDWSWAERSAQVQHVCAALDESARTGKVVPIRDR